jgi:hypothetical protein
MKFLNETKTVAVLSIATLAILCYIIIKSKSVEKDENPPTDAPTLKAA